MSANHSDCRCTIRGDRGPVTGSRYTTLLISSQKKAAAYNFRDWRQRRTVRHGRRLGQRRRRHLQLTSAQKLRLSWRGDAGSARWTGSTARRRLRLHLRHRRRLSRCISTAVHKCKYSIIITYFAILSLSRHNITIILSPIFMFPLDKPQSLHA